MMKEISNNLKTTKENCLIIGDRIETDIALGNNFNIDTALVKTGVKKHPNGNGSIEPTYVLRSVNEILTKTI